MNFSGMGDIESNPTNNICKLHRMGGLRQTLLFKLTNLKKKKKDNWIAQKLSSLLQI